MREDVSIPSLPFGVRARRSASEALAVRLIARSAVPIHPTCVLASVSPPKPRERSHDARLGMLEGGE